MTYNWKETELGNIVEFKNGKKPESVYEDINLGKYSLYGGNGVYGSTDNFNGEDINIIGRVGAYCGSVHYKKEKAWVSDNAIAVKPKNEDVLDSKFLYNFLLSSNLNRLKVGTSQPLLNQSILKGIKINLPPLQEQKAIANILSAIDDKIELNNKINQNLEAQAQAIFKSWFIDFEPFQDGEFIESELGMIPKGWEVGELGNSKLGKLITSGIEDYNGQKIYLATADVSETKIINNDTLITIKDRPSRANMQPRPNTIWFAKMKDSRKLILVDKLDYVLQNNYIFSTGFAGIQCTELSIYYLWTYIQSKLFDIKKNSLCTGTTMQAINNENINKIKILIPEKTILEKFNKIVGPMYQIIINTREQNTRLAELRDTLLPKLISGEIRIPLDK